MAPTASELMRVFGRIGLLSFGGPAAQISLMQQELVEKRDWLDEQTFLRALSLCMLLPGPEAMQLATYAGWRLRGIQGGLIAGGLFVIPGAVVIAVLVGLYAAFGTLPLVQAGFLGVKATVIVIVLQALNNLARKAMTSAEHYALAGLSFLSIFALNLPFPFIILVAGIWGAYRFSAANSPAIPPTTTKPRDQFRTGVLCLTLWLVPLVVLSISGHKLLADIGWFFARLAVVTFGGAYAVLAYMTQTVVDKYQWVSTAQMIDALGLAETTPGPLILVTQFVAMLAGQLSGGPWLAVAAGLVALWATFVPCFLWIFIAAPHLDQLGKRPSLAAALNGITAAVVGVILNLSVWFGLNVIFHRVSEKTWWMFTYPWPSLSNLNLSAVCLTVIAWVLIFKFKFGMALTLAVMAAAGIGFHVL